MQKLIRCERCGKIMHESDNHVSGVFGIFQNYCYQCAYLKGLVTEAEFLYSCGVYIEDAKAFIHPQSNEILVVIGMSIPPWEETNAQQRRSPAYRNWRKQVIKRDRHTCQNCGSSEGIFEAHHKKSFSLHKDLRYEVSNGITLCKECHKNIHKRR